VRISRLKGDAESAGGYLHHLVYGFRCDEKQDFSGRGDDGSLFRNIVCLTLKCELRKMVDLGKEVEG
jgi:hypothetical protein